MYQSFPMKYSGEPRRSIVLQEKPLPRFRIGRTEALVAFIALVAMGAAIGMTLGRFIDTNPAITGHVYSAAILFAAGLTATYGWWKLTTDKNGVSYDLVNILIGVFAAIEGFIILPWFTLNGVV